VGVDKIWFQNLDTSGDNPGGICGRLGGVNSAVIFWGEWVAFKVGFGVIEVGFSGEGGARIFTY
jgi:hypothetical protein